MNNVFTYNENTRTLIIKAEADLSDLKKDEAFTSPWSTYEASVEHLILEDIDSIGSYHFKNLPNLFSVTFPPTLRSVHHHAFFGCKSLTEINLPMGYTLNSIYEPAPIPEKSIRYGLSAFKFTPYLEDAQGTYFIKDAFLISVNKNLDIHEIPEGITRIHPLAFEDILAKTVILPASLKSFDPITFAVSAPRLMIFKNHETEISNDGNNLSEKNNKIPPLYNLRATNIPGSALKKLEVCEVSSYKAYHEASKDSKAAPSDIPHVKGHRYLDLSEAMLKRLNQGHYLIMINKEKEESILYEMLTKDVAYLRKDYEREREDILTLDELLLELPESKNGEFCHEKGSLNPGSHDNWYQLSPLSTGSGITFTFSLY